MNVPGPPSEPDRTRARQLANESFERGDPTGWFERLYQESEQGTAVLPWAELRPNPNLVSWSRPDLTGKTALVSGCGLGDDAELLAEWGALVTAFDVAPTAIAVARRRFPTSKVDYQTADLLNPPTIWTRRFDFVFEAYTLQALPADVRPMAIRAVGGFVAPSGQLLVVARGRDEGDPAGDMPWPLTRDELGEFERLGMLESAWEDYFEGTIRRFRVLYRRP